MAELVRAFAERHQAQLDAAGTLVSFEELTAQIGDPLAWELATQQLRRRSAEVSAAATQACPECGAACPVESDPEPVLLRGLPGELKCTEPRCRCTRCRRDFFPLAGRLGRPVRESVTPLVLENLVWAGANLASDAQATAAMNVLAGICLAVKQVRRITTQAGNDRLKERREQAAAFQSLPLAERTSPHPTAEPPELGVVMPYGGRMQRRDLFAPRGSSKTPRTERESGRERS